jgi:hypothetical protein
MLMGATRVFSYGGKTASLPKGGSQRIYLDIMLKLFNTVFTQNYWVFGLGHHQVFQNPDSLDMHLALFLGPDIFRYSTSIFLIQMMVKLIT